MYRGGWWHQKKFFLAVGYWAVTLMTPPGDIKLKASVPIRYLIPWDLIKTWHSLPAIRFGLKIDGAFDWYFVSQSWKEQHQHWWWHIACFYLTWNIFVCHLKPFKQPLMFSHNVWSTHIYGNRTVLCGHLCVFVEHTNSKQISELE